LNIPINLAFWWWPFNKVLESFFYAVIARSVATWPSNSFFKKMRLLHFVRHDRLSYESAHSYLSMIKGARPKCYDPWKNYLGNIGRVFYNNIEISGNQLAKG
jgi:hypothetical protein